MSLRSPFEDQKSYYDRHWVAGKDLNIDQKCRRRFIVAHVEKIRADFGRQLRILDLGCGKGWLTAILSKYGAVLGVDLSIDVAKKLYPHLEFRQANIITDEIEGQYDVTVSSEVIEHLETESQPILVRRCYELLGQDGYLILTTPNKSKVEELVATLSIRRDQLQPIENWLDRRSLLTLLHCYFEVRAFSFVMFYPTVCRKYRLLGIPYSFLYDKLSCYTFADRILNQVNRQGLYSAIIAKKRS